MLFYFASTGVFILRDARATTGCGWIFYDLLLLELLRFHGNPLREH
tara:strand:- start:20 stop:157 length:138 start_codon:yes stop_codon:yes gene_type:complete